MSTSLECFCPLFLFALRTEWKERRKVLLLIPLKPGMFGFMLKEGMVVGRKRGEEGHPSAPSLVICFALQLGVQPVMNY